MKTEEKMDSETKEKTRILIVDDQPVIREELTQIINRQVYLLVCSETGNIDEDAKAVEKQKIDLALVDMLLNSTTGIEVIKRIRILSPNIVALIFSMSNKSQYVKQAIEARARGYITKDETAEEIVNAIRRILKAQIYISAADCLRICQMKNVIAS